MHFIFALFILCLGGFLVVVCILLYVACTYLQVHEIGNRVQIEQRRSSNIVFHGVVIIVNRKISQ